MLKNNQHVGTTSHFQHICCLHQALTKFSSPAMGPESYYWDRASQLPVNMNHPPWFFHFQDKGIFHHYLGIWKPNEVIPHQEPLQFIQWQQLSLVQVYWRHWVNTILIEFWFLRSPAVVIFKHLFLRLYIYLPHYSFLILLTQATFLNYR